MARKSRYAKPEEQEEIVIERDTEYRAAIYLRLSVSKKRNPISASDSIESQKEIIMEYLRQFPHPEIEICQVYIDDGYTGK